MTSVGESACRLMRELRTATGPGMSDQELTDVEGAHGFRFSPDYRYMLGELVPEGAGWMDWRADREHVAAELNEPLEGVLFDVAVNSFWAQAWPQRPAAGADAALVAREELAKVPRLLRVYGNRFVPARPAGEACPIFSAHQSDVIYYGHDLADYLRIEFLGALRVPEGPAHRRVTFWSDLAEAVG